MLNSSVTYHVVLTLNPYKLFSLGLVMASVTVTLVFIV